MITPRLNMKLQDGSDISLDAPDPHEAIRRFVAREGEFAGEWVEVNEGGDRVRFVRYDQITQVSTVGESD